MFLEEYNMSLVGEIIALFLLAIPILGDGDELHEKLTEKLGMPTVSSSKGYMWKKDGIKICLFKNGLINNRLRLTVPLTKEQNADSERLICSGVSYHNKLHSSATIKGNTWEDITNVLIKL